MFTQKLRIFLLIFQAVYCMGSLHHIPEVLPDMKNAKISIDPHLKQDNKASGSSIPDKEQIIQQYISTYPELQYQYVAASKDGKMQ
ncbi:hypothetical protein PGT21_002279 [Puccinia graminis f. sp. tritici]|uniref:Uncharacterized protein n=1 Tax=Puccinia graminis f. sp. tritici TaxID=56615 RepID=A0A5B0Q1W1_PUCGR|nr:hypothetical protein PGT21_002279 [Puccinia graminis f. sp. tritici]KAA1127888.1 hypothetical protein PGTUg99_004784 [Puccinia graminis f. sp. tritici]